MIVYRRKNTTVLYQTTGNLSPGVRVIPVSKRTSWRCLNNSGASARLTDARCNWCDIRARTTTERPYRRTIGVNICSIITTDMLPIIFHSLTSREGFIAGRPEGALLRDKANTTRMYDTRPIDLIARYFAYVNHNLIILQIK